MNNSPTQFAWACCSGGDYPPPEPKKGERYGPDSQCALCGGATDGVGWPRKLGLPDTFTEIPRLAAPASQTLCQACTATLRTEGWAHYVAQHPERGFTDTFPAREGKRPRAINWLHSCHLFASGHHECPDRARWRELLLHPPEPPFLAIITLSGKKPLLFKSRIAMSQTQFPVQMEDQSVWVIPVQLKAALEAFMALYLMGCSKDAILTGHYPAVALITASTARWYLVEQTARYWRRGNPSLWILCHYLAQRPDGWVLPGRTPSGEAS